MTDCGWYMMCKKEDKVQGHARAIFGPNMLTVPMCDDCYKAHLEMIILNPDNSEEVIERTLTLSHEDRAKEVASIENHWEKMNAEHKRCGNEGDIPEWFGNK